MLENGLKMHVGFFFIILFPYIKGELHLIISEYVDDGFLRPVNSSVELTAGANFYLVCMVGGQGTFSKPNLRWGRKSEDLKFRNENDLRRLAENSSNLFDELRSSIFRDYYYESNKVIRPFNPVKVSDRGVHFCTSLKYMLFKIVHVKVKEPSKCGPNKFHCKKSGHCIGLHYKCDGRYDCPDQSDESRVLCNGDPCLNKIRCDDGMCIPKSWCCDKHNDVGCNVTVRPACCPPLLSTYDPMLWYNKKVQTTATTEVGKGSGSKYLFITICVVSALLSFVLFLFVISKICGFDAKPHGVSTTSCSNVCEHSECVLRRQFSADVTCLYRRDVERIDNNELADPLIIIDGRAGDQPPSYSEVISTTMGKCDLDDLINAPPPPYSSTKFTTDDCHVGNNDSNRRCDNIPGDNESS